MSSNNNTPKWVKLWVKKHHDALLSLDKEDAGEILQNIVRYACGEELSEMSKFTGMVFSYLKQDIDECLEVYDRKAEVARENGLKGGRPRKDQFIPPTLEEIEEYCQEEGLIVSSENFYNYNAARGWKMGGRYIEDWKALLRLWKDNNQFSNNSNNDANIFIQ